MISASRQQFRASTVSPWWRLSQRVATDSVPNSEHHRSSSRRRPGPKVNRCRFGLGLCRGDEFIHGALIEKWNETASSRSRPHSENQPFAPAHALDQIAAFALFAEPRWPPMVRLTVFGSALHASRHGRMSDLGRARESSPATSARPPAAQAPGLVRDETSPLRTVLQRGPYPAPLLRACRFASPPAAAPAGPSRPIARRRAT